MDPRRKRAIRMTLALTAALLLASALIYTSFSAGRDELSVSQLLARARPGHSYILAGTVLGGYRHQGDALLFRVRDPQRDEAVSVRYTGVVPDPFAAGRGVLVAVHETRAGAHMFVGENGSMSTKCPSKYQAAPPSGA